MHEDDFFDGFHRWLDSKDGETSMVAMDAVFEALEGAGLNVKERKIIWLDGKALTIHQTAKRIQHQTEIDLKAIKSHIVGWLEMEYEPKGLDETQMEIFEEKIQNWIDDFQAGKAD